MSPKTPIEIRHVARLSRLELTDAETKLFESQVAGILDFMAELDSLDVSRVEPTSHPLSLSDVFREDEIRPSLKIEDVLKHAPKSKGRFFEVPKIIEDKS